MLFSSNNFWETRATFALSTILMSLCPKRLEEAAALDSFPEQQELAMFNAEFICERLRQNSTVLALPELVWGAKATELELFKDAGEMLDLGPIHVANLYEALQWLSESTRKQVTSLGFFDSTIADRDVELLVEIVSLFPNLKELDLGRSDLLIPRVDDMHALLENVALLRIEETELAGFVGGYFFESLSEKQVKKVIFLTRQAFRLENFDFFVPEEYFDAVIETHEAFFAQMDQLLEDKQPGPSQAPTETTAEPPTPCAEPTAAQCLASTSTTAAPSSAPATLTTTITTTTPPHSLMAGRVAVSTLVLCACTAPCWTRRGGQYRAPTDLWD
eukprot:m.137498 g.137498  ORF g.137498 m.137498 type:complete len:331 (-) comp14899_c0_seq10:425-1417(-)